MTSPSHPMYSTSDIREKQPDFLQIKNKIHKKITRCCTACSGFSYYIYNFNKKFIPPDLDLQTVPIYNSSKPAYRLNECLKQKFRYHNTALHPDVKREEEETTSTEQEIKPLFPSSTPPILTSVSTPTKLPIISPPPFIVSPTSSSSSFSSLSRTYSNSSCCSSTPSISSMPTLIPYNEHKTFYTDTESLSDNTSMATEISPITPTAILKDEDRKTEERIVARISRIDIGERMNGIPRWRLPLCMYRNRPQFLMNTHCYAFMENDPCSINPIVIAYNKTLEMIQHSIMYEEICNKHNEQQWITLSDSGLQLDMLTMVIPGFNMIGVASKLDRLVHEVLFKAIYGDDYVHKGIIDMKMTNMSWLRFPPTKGLQPIHLDHENFRNVSVIIYINKSASTMMPVYHRKHGYDPSLTTWPLEEADRMRIYQKGYDIIWEDRELYHSIPVNEFDAMVFTNNVLHFGQAHQGDEARDAIFISYTAPFDNTKDAGKYQIYPWVYFAMAYGENNWRVTQAVVRDREIHPMEHHDYEYGKQAQKLLLQTAAELIVTAPGQNAKEVDIKTLLEAGTEFEKQPPTKCRTKKPTYTNMYGPKLARRAAERAAAQTIAQPVRTKKASRKPATTKRASTKRGTKRKAAPIAATPSTAPARVSKRAKPVASYGEKILFPPPAPVRRAKATKKKAAQSDPEIAKLLMDIETMNMQYTTLHIPISSLGCDTDTESESEQEAPPVVANVAPAPVTVKIER